MDWCEIKIEVPAARADEIDTLLLELGVGGWSLLEDAIAKRAWVVGIFPDEAEAKLRWDELNRLLPGAPLAEPMWRVLADSARIPDPHPASMTRRAP